jgi:hypothetical protein
MLGWAVYVFGVTDSLLVRLQVLILPIPCSADSSFVLYPVKAASQSQSSTPIAIPRSRSANEMRHDVIEIDLTADSDEDAAARAASAPEKAGA